MVTAKDILEHRMFYGIEKPVQDMSVKEYAYALQKGAVVTINPHGFIMDSFSGMPLAADGEQLDLLIEHLETLRKYLPGKNIIS